MRTTVIFDNDVATRLTDLRHERNISFRQMVNTAVREWLSTAELAVPHPPAHRKTTADAVAAKREPRFEAPVVRGGKWLAPEGLVCARDILDWAEEDAVHPGVL